MQRHQNGAPFKSIESPCAAEVHLPPRLASRHRLGAALGGQQREGALDSGGEVGHGRQREDPEDLCRHVYGDFYGDYGILTGVFAWEYEWVIYFRVKWPFTSYNHLNSIKSLLIH